MHRPVRLILFGLLILCSCRKDIPFDQQAWIDGVQIENDGGDRPRMVQDLTEHYGLKGMHFSELKSLLGEPSYSAGKLSKVQYVLHMEYQNGEPVAGKDLVFELGPDSTVKSFRIEDWKR